MKINSLVAYAKSVMMKKSTRLPLVISAVVILWMLSGIVFTNEAPYSPKVFNTTQKMSVQASEIYSKKIEDIVVVQGALEPARMVEIKSHTSAHVIEIPNKKGSFVLDGTLLYRLATVDRSAKFFSAKAKITKNEKKITQLQKLSSTDPSQLNKLKIAKVKLKVDQASLKRIISERGNILIQAPFSGIFEDQLVEVGSHVEKGGTLAVILDESTLKAVGYVSQQSVGKLRLGQQVIIYLLDGQKTKGTLTYIASSGDTKTHSFKVEAELTHLAKEIKSGASAKIEIITGSVVAHFISPASLSLDINGHIGIKSVTKKSLVRFYPIKILRTEKDGVWITGLPHKIKIITQGHGFVNEGESVEEISSS